MDIVDLKSKVAIEVAFVKRMTSRVYLEPSEDKIKGSRLLGFCVVNILIYLTSIQLSIGLINLKSDTSKLIQITDICPNIGVCVLAAMKCAEMHQNRKFYQDTFDHFRYRMLDITTENLSEFNSISSKYLFIIKNIGRFMYYYTTVISIIINSVPWLVTMFEIKILGKSNITLLYPFDGLYPFDTHEYNNLYHLVYIWEAFMTYMVIVVHVVCGIMRAAVILFICLELRLLGNSLCNLIPDGAEGYNGNDDVDGQVKSKLRTLIIRHTYLFKVSKKLDKAFGSTMLIYSTFGSLLFCLTAFSSTVVEMQRAIRYLCFFLSLNVEMGIPCIMGQVLSDHSVQLVQDIYYSNWINADKSTKKTLLILLMHTQKPFIFTAKGYCVMNLHTFGQICSVAYRFFNLLRNVYEP